MTPEPTTNVSVFDCDHQSQGSQPEPTETQPIVYEVDRKQRINTKHGILTPTKVSVTPTTEERLRDIRTTMNYFIPRETVGRSTGRIAGWYSTEQTYKW